MAGEEPSTYTIRHRLRCLLKTGKDPELDRGKGDGGKGAGTPASDEERTVVSLAAGKATADLEWSAQAGASESDPKPADGGIGAVVWKVVGAAATGITATGFVVAVGGAIFWIRFNEVGLPTTQAVGLLSKNELLVQGAQETIVFAGVAVVAVGLLFVFDPEGRMTRRPFALLVLLAAFAVGYVCFATQLPWGLRIALALLACALFASVVVVGVRSGATFWPLALALFVASLLFSAATGLLIVQHQKFAQPVAVLRGATDAGVTGIYVTASDSTIYIGRLIPGGSEDEPDRRGMFDVPRDGATFAVGPLESIGKAEAQADDLLEQLKNDRERNPAAATAESAAPADDDAAAGEGSDSESDKSPTGESATKQTGTGETAAAPPPEQIATVANAFDNRVRVHNTVERPWGCLVQFASAERTQIGHWWTTCAEYARLNESTMLEVRQALALPGRFQPVYDMRLTGRLPLGSSVLYLTGDAASQCEHEPPTGCLHQYVGGATQVYLPEPQLVEVQNRECTPTRQDQTPLWKECALR